MGDARGTLSGYDTITAVSGQWRDELPVVCMWHTPQKFPCKVVAHAGNMEQLENIISSVF